MYPIQQSPTNVSGIAGVGFNTTVPSPMLSTVKPITKLYQEVQKSTTEQEGSPTGGQRLTARIREVNMTKLVEQNGKLNELNTSLLQSNEFLGDHNEHLVSANIAMETENRALKEANLRLQADNVVLTGGLSSSASGSLWIDNASDRFIKTQ